MTMPVLVAGGAGDLGARIVTALVRKGADVRALVREDTPARTRQRLSDLGAAIVPADVHHVDSVAQAARGAGVVISVLNGVRDVIIDRQLVLLEAAVKAGVPRFVPSDFAGDFTRSAPGHNRNLDLRREFMASVDEAPIQATSVLNGVFMDMLGVEIPIVAPKIRRILHWGSADQGIDLTTKNDVAAYTANVAFDDNAPRILRIAGETVTARGLAGLASDITGHRYRTLRLGRPATLGRLAALMRRTSRDTGEPFPAWQGMQYARDMFSGDIKLISLDSDRYPGMTWTPVRAVLQDRLTTASS